MGGESIGVRISSMIINRKIHCDEETAKAIGG
jgi:hypothetical protein